MENEFSVTVEDGKIYMESEPAFDDRSIMHLEIEEAEELIEMLRMAVNAARLYD